MRAEGAETSPTTSSLFHTLPIFLPDDGHVRIRAACIQDEAIAARQQAPTYAPSLGVVIPEKTVTLDDAVVPTSSLYALEHASTTYQLPRIPSRLLAEEQDDEHGMSLETGALQELRAQYSLAQRDIAAFVHAQRESLVVSIEDAKEHVRRLAQTAEQVQTLSSRASPSPEASEVHESAGVFVKRAPPAPGTSPERVGGLAASFAKLGRSIQRAEFAYPPSVPAPARAATPQPGADEGASETGVPSKDSTPRPDARRVLFSGCDEEEDSVSEGESPIFATDEDLTLEAETGQSPPPLTRSHLHKHEEEHDALAVQQLQNKAARSFAGVADASNPLHASRSATGSDSFSEAYERDQEGPYDLVGRDHSGPSSLASGRAISRPVHPKHRATFHSDALLDDDAAFAHVVAANTPSHRKMQSSLGARAMQEMHDDASTGYRTPTTESPNPLLAQSVPSKAQGVLVPYATSTTRQEMADGWDREPKTSVPHKEHMLVPSLRQAIRAQRRTPSGHSGMHVRPPAPASYGQSLRTVGMMARDERRVTSSPTSTELPPIPHVPSASVRVRLGKESAPRSLSPLFDDKTSTPLALSQLLYYMHYLQNLKLSKRTGWYHHGIPAPESIADHMYRMAMLTMLVDPAGLDLHKCMAMALVHDLAEASVGDLTPMCHVDKAEKQRREAEAMRYFMHELLADSSAAEQIMALWNEYEERATPEARLVKDLDCFELCLQAYEYEQEHSTADLQQFWLGACSKIVHPQVQEWARALLRKRRTLWESRGKPYDDLVAP